MTTYLDKYFLEDENKEIREIAAAEITDDQGNVVGYEYAGITFQSREEAEAALISDLEKRGWLDYVEISKEVAALEEIHPEDDGSGYSDERAVGWTHSYRQTTSRVFTLIDKYRTSQTTLELPEAEADTSVTFTLNIRFWENAYVQQSGQATAELVAEGANVGRVKISIPFRFSRDNMYEKGAKSYPGTYSHYAGVSEFGAARCVDVTIKRLPTVSHEDDVVYLRTGSCDQDEPSIVRQTLNKAGKWFGIYNRLDVKLGSQLVINKAADGSGGNALDSELVSVTAAYGSQESGYRQLRPISISPGVSGEADIKVFTGERDLRLTEKTPVTVTSTIRYFYQDRWHLFDYIAVAYPTADTEINSFANSESGYYRGFELVLSSERISAAVEEHINSKPVIKENIVRQVEVATSVALFESRVLVTYGYAADPYSSIKKLPVGLDFPELPAATIVESEDMVSSAIPDGVTGTVYDSVNCGAWSFSYWEPNASRGTNYTAYSIVGYWTFESAEYKQN